MKRFSYTPSLVAPYHAAPHWFSAIVANNPYSLGWSERIARNNPTQSRPLLLNPTQEQEDDALLALMAEDGDSLTD